MKKKYSHKRKEKDHFKIALLLIYLTIVISLVAFKSADNSITGHIVNQNDLQYIEENLPEYGYIGELETLSPGNYFVDEKGIIYWIDDESRPAVGKVNFLYDVQKNRQLYIDNDGNIGYIVS
jgi:hypothetical protein